MADKENGRFSRRFGFADHRGGELIRHDAPESLRCGLLQAAIEAGLRPSPLRQVVCGTLRVRPNPANWSEYPNVLQEVEDLVHGCDWCRVYDIIEATYAGLPPHRKAGFETSINTLFAEEGIGWQLIDGEIQIRGDETFDAVVAQGRQIVEASGMAVAHQELREAIQDLSRRPEPDLSGAVQHAMAALECAARETSGEAKPTLGELIKRYPDLFPKPIDEAVARLWGYASEQARHGRESRILTWEEAQFVVGIVAILCSYVSQKLRKQDVGKSGA